MTRLPATTDNEPEPAVNRILIPAHRATAGRARRPSWASDRTRYVRVPMLTANRRSILGRLLTVPGAWMHVSDLAATSRDRYPYGSPAYSVLTRVMTATRDMAALMAGATLDGAALATETREPIERTA